MRDLAVDYKAVSDRVSKRIMDLHRYDMFDFVHYQVIDMS